MTILRKVLVNKQVSCKSVWFMRQAGRYLPEFRKIRSDNRNFINLCLNSNLSSEITLQPIHRYDLDAAIIFSDILMVPYALGQNVEFIKDEVLSIIDYDYQQMMLQSVPNGDHQYGVGRLEKYKESEDLFCVPVFPELRYTIEPSLRYIIDFCPKGFFLVIICF